MINVREMVILIVVTLAVTVPFLGQAFHWDDPDFILQAQVLAEDPTRFDVKDYDARGRHYERFPLRHPPLTSYYLALFITIAGGVSETLFHSAFLIFPVIAAVSMYSLGRRFTRGSPLAAALLFILSPGVMVMSHTVMGNMPGVALWLAATALFVHGADRRHWGLLMLSGVAMAADVMIFAQALGLLPLLLFYVIINRRFRLPVFLSFLIPVVVYASWRYYIRSKYGHPPAISYRANLNYNWQIRDIITFLGGAMLFPVSAWMLFLQRKVDVLLGFIAIPPLVTWAAVYYLSRDDLTLAQALQVAVIVGAGFLILYGLAAGVFRDGWRLVKERKLATDNLFLLAWVVVVISPYFISTLPFVAVRHMLPLFAPLALVFVREAEKLNWRPRLKTAFLAGTIVLTGIMALSASIADYRLAGLYRQTADQMLRDYGDSPVKVWSLGEFGWRYYMEKNGFEYMGVNDEAGANDLVIVSRLSAENLVGPLPEGFYQEESRLEPADAFPIRTMNPWARAGFYGNPLGPIPIAFSRAKLDEITVNRLTW